LFDKLTGNDLYDEDISLGLRVVLVDAFMRCKILEEPKKIVVEQYKIHKEVTK